MITNKPHPVIMARYPDPSILGARVFRSGKYKGQKWSDADKKFWSYMLLNVLKDSPFAEIYLYAYWRCTAEDSIQQQVLPLKKADGSKFNEVAVFKNLLLKDIEPLKGMNPKLMKFQQEVTSGAVRYWEKRKERQEFFGLMLALEQGCLSGDTIVKIARGRNGTISRSFELREAYVRASKSWKKDVPMYIKNFNGHELRLARIKEIHSSGQKEVYLVTTSKGYSIKATQDHRFMINPQSDYQALGNLGVGDQVMVNGSLVRVCAVCGNEKRFPFPSAIKRAKNPNICKKCSWLKMCHEKRTTSKLLPLGQVYDKSGYVMVIRPDHPHARKRDKQICYHRLVMEEYLGRFLDPKEEIVHHIDEDKSNNSIDNLRLMSRLEHNKLHGDANSRNFVRGKFGQKLWWVPEADTIVSKVLVGVEDTYDIEMEGDYPNFVANGFVVHNSGKTAVSISIVELCLMKLGVTMSNARVLVICPASLITNWAREIKMWSRFGESSKVIHVNSKLMKAAGCITGTKGAEGTTLASAGWFTCSYSYAWRCQLLLNSSFDCVIFDESQALKGGDNTKQGELAYILKTTRIGKLFLSGTPMTGGAKDMYPIARASLVEKFDQGATCGGRISEHDFMEDYTYTRETQYGTMRYGVKNPGKLGELLSDFTVRLTRKEVLPDLPDMQRVKVFLDADPKELTKISKLTDSMRQHLDVFLGNQDSMDGAYQPQFASIRRMMGVAKVEPLMEIINTIREGSDEPLVIYYMHTEVGDRIETNMANLGCKVARIDGSTKIEDRGALVQGFQSGEYDVFLGNIKAAGTGITLTRASTIIFAEFDWTYASNTQVEARILRIGAKAKVRAIYAMLSEGDGVRSIDERVFDTFFGKGKAISAVFDEAPPEQADEQVVKITGETDEERARIKFYNEQGAAYGSDPSEQEA